MSAESKMNLNPAPEDRALAIDFLDGRLAADESAQFEARLVAEPLLGALVEELFTTEGALRALTSKQRVALEDVRARRARRRFAIVGGLVAAAAGLAWIAVLVFGDRALDVAQLQVAAVPSFESAREYVSAHPEIAGLRPPGLDELRGASEEPNVGADDFLKKAAAIVPGTDDKSAVSARFFRVNLHIERAAYALVVAFPEHGSPARLFPDPEAESDPAPDGRVGPGDVLLPRASFALFVDAQGRRFVDYDRGFLVPAGSQHVHALVALSAEPFERALVAEIDASIRASSDEARVRKLLEGRVLALRTIAIDEPAH